MNTFCYFVISKRCPPRRFDMIANIRTKQIRRRRRWRWTEEKGNKNFGLFLCIKRKIFFQDILCHVYFDEIQSEIKSNSFKIKFKSLWRKILTKKISIQDQRERDKYFPNFESTNQITQKTFSFYIILDVKLLS